MVDLMPGARTAVEMCLAVKPGENVLIVTDTGKVGIARALVAASKGVGAETILMIMSPRKYNGEEPPRPVASAMRHTDVFFFPTTKSLSHTRARVEATRAVARGASMPGITEDIFVGGAMTADYREVAIISRRMADLLAKSDRAIVTTGAGTSLEMSLEGRKPDGEAGLFLKPGEWGNLPAGEAYIAPVEESVNGLAVIDGSFGSSIVGEPVKLTIKNGRVVDIEGGKDAKTLKSLLSRVKDDNAYWIAELGVGTNPKARITGVVLEDEKALGTVHIALGKNTDFGGRIDSKIHMDLIMMNATLKLDDTLVLKNGKLMGFGNRD